MVMRLKVAPSLPSLIFFLRYPAFLNKALLIRKSNLELKLKPGECENIENRMVRYRYGPWDPAYFSIIGRLIGKGLVKPVSLKKGLGFKITETGQKVAQDLSLDENWSEIAARIKLLYKHLNLSGHNLKNFIYKHFPEISEASWGEKL